jgi:CRISPR-associated protein Csb2
MSLALGIRYLSGHAVATSPTNREEAEWPPHPARILMAMAAAHFETGGAPAERQALHWLESQPPPALSVPEALPRSVCTVYVPVNDKAGPAKSLLQSAPGLPRSRQPRAFPTVYVGDEPLFCMWPDAVPDEATRIALASVCAKVTRVGHSSSLVQMWLAEQPPEPTLVPVGTGGETHLRVASPGTLQYLEERYNGAAIECFAELDERIRSTKGKEQKQAKAEFLATFGVAWRSSATPPPSIRPVISLTQGYRRTAEPQSADATGVLDDRLVILAKGEGPALALESALALTNALRGAAMATCPRQPPPEWLSGHTPESGASQCPHLAFVPLPYVGAEHADGHIMGMALAFPRAVPLAERGRCLSGLVASDEGVRLTLGKLGVWTLLPEERSHPPSALRSETWTGPADTWASVTPVVLDRFPKTNRNTDRQRWEAEVASIVRQSCRNTGLPEPVQIDIDGTSWQLGAPGADPTHGGFPAMPARPGKPSRFQVHVWLRFGQPVRGPVLIGAGRYLGYGLCKPWETSQGKGGAA